jgi:hypothetical protein
MLVGTPSGSSYSETEYLDWLRQVGFDDPSMIALPGPTDLVVAQRTD